MKKNPTRCNNVSKFCYSIFIWSLTCFGWHAAHHQEPKTALAASGLVCLTTYTIYMPNNLPHMKNQRLPVAHCAWQRPLSTRPTTSHIWKTRSCQCSFRLLMMGGVSPKTCWVSYKYGIIKFWLIVAFCWVFLYELYHDAWIHEHQVCSGI
jgi:hypothetical protein